MDENFLKWQEKKQGEVDEKAKRYSAFASKKEDLKDQGQAIDNAPRINAELKIYLKELLGLARTSWREWMSGRIDEVRRRKVALFEESAVNVAFFPENQRWRWLPCWLREEDIDAIVDSMEEIPGALTDKERKAKRAAIDKQILEIEKEMQKLLE